MTGDLMVKQMQRRAKQRGVDDLLIRPRDVAQLADLFGHTSALATSIIAFQIEQGHMKIYDRPIRVVKHAV